MTSTLDSTISRHYSSHMFLAPEVEFNFGSQIHIKNFQEVEAQSQKQHSSNYPFPPEMLIEDPYSSSISITSSCSSLAEFDHGNRSPMHENFDNDKSEIEYWIYSRIQSMKGQSGLVSELDAPKIGFSDVNPELSNFGAEAESCDDIDMFQLDL
mmetsp:Transcript_20187/g.20288  ORF Transcript_20187/g.20288 Transcript_20187/m.20288 type:complete len:154 (+) Transcript_20187:62-523(+)|eukprot:CAMPEP_0182428572 /NCGR_PEP_ID=MMETSP1167-20130531/23116_1 /TAXON_ID=2988 /ORGANISM="Mallomonas Sp, Strain CCMP3275" /LENGTH=153 /DNA_ID=CAMNT_0024611537 /DNA_START=58 /DNA_END=519 /DNA_ORIENTATION=-